MPKETSDEKKDDRTIEKSDEKSSDAKKRAAKTTEKSEEDDMLLPLTIEELGGISPFGRVADTLPPPHSSHSATGEVTPTASPLATPTTNPPGTLPNTGIIAIDDIDFDNFQLIPDDAKIYRRKIPKYKEVKHYIKGEKLGKGKFGTVREFVDKATLKRYAGKIIKRAILRRDPHLRRQINKELAITYHFDHVNIMRVYDLFMASQKIYLFMEFCYGELGEFLESYRTLPKCQAKDFFAQICEGLDYLHSRGIIHRDIKPENVLLSDDHVLKLADFGVCQNVDLFAADDLVGGNDGTPLYHAPELFDFDILKYSGSAVDVWAAGVVLYQMIVGEVPFFKRGELTPEEHNAIMHKSPDYPAAVRADILLHDLFNQLLAKDFHRRITIARIRKHLWMQIRCTNKSAHYRRFPTANRAADHYRGITVLTRIHERLFPTPEAEASQLIDMKEFEASRQVRPLARGQRVIGTKRAAELKRERITFN